MEILKITQAQANEVGYIVTSYGKVEGIPATARNKATFPDAEIVEVESEHTIDFFEDQEKEIVESWRSTASLTRRKFMLGIKFYQWGKGTLEDAITALQASLPEPQKTVIGVSLDSSNYFERADPELIAMATEIGMTAEQIDAFFHFAENEEWRNG